MKCPPPTPQAYLRDLSIWLSAEVPQDWPDLAKAVQAVFAEQLHATLHDLNEETRNDE